jgi:DNA ligase D-like protein (predicted 3'-phosphoesterase)
MQEHHTDLPHLDFRLEIDGVLKSWVIPEGLPTAAGQRQQALQMEDHPLEYADFEGVIPTGEYGEGNVRIRDRGTFENLTKMEEGLMPLDKALDEGYLEFRFKGEQMSRVFFLQRTAGGAEPHWVLVKGWDQES